MRISGGDGKQGFPMRQGILTNNRARILCGKGQKGYRPRRTGERTRKSLRGCIVAQDIAVLNLVITKEGDNPIPGLTDESVPRPLGPKRANNIRKLFNLSKEDDARKHVITLYGGTKGYSANLAIQLIQKYGMTSAKKSS